MSLRRRPPRGLTEAERELWERAMRDVHPLRRRRLKSSPPPLPDAALAEGPPVPPAAPRPLARRIKAEPPAAKPAPVPPAHPPLAPLERRTRQRLARGTIALDDRIDLHGLTQQAAYGRLARFLAEAQQRSHQIVLVITGKGVTGNGTRAAERGHHGDERGVLRRTVPLWLKLPEMRAMVVGFEPAGPTHGGDGALYVRIRRRRGVEGGA